MRLIDTSNLRLVNRYDGDIPPYAILSHTWGSEDDEVTYQEFQNLKTGRLRKSMVLSNPVLKKPGFSKIRGAAELAASRGYEFIWIDTVCIDKTSSAELSEAINSMYRWYRNAAVCFAYFSDVDGLDNASNGAGSLRNIRWFERGWTLQELIAPSEVEFYSRSWNYLGSKTRAHLPEYTSRRLGSNSTSGSPLTINPEFISAVTGIDIGILLGSKLLEDMSVAQKMQWAAKRQSTRVEDVAYSLMGIFNVNMPLLYGEGERAFIRLQEEILKETNDQSIFAWRCPHNDILRYQQSGLLALKPSYFLHSAHVAPSLDTSRGSSPSTRSNVGLHVEFDLVPATIVDEAQGLAPLPGSGNRFYAILDTRPFYPKNTSETTAERAQSRDYYRFAILLTSLDGDHFARVNSDVLPTVLGNLPLSTNRIVRRYVYVKQIPIHGFPDIVYEPELFANLRMARVFPEYSWNEQTRTLKADQSGRTSVLGAFRYSITYGYHTEAQVGSVDIFIGHSSSHHSNSGSSWYCFQQDSNPEETLEQSAFHFDHHQHRHMGLSDRSAHGEVLAVVKTSRLASRICISLKLSPIYELSGTLSSRDNGDRSALPTRVDHEILYELADTGVALNTPGQAEKEPEGALPDRLAKLFAPPVMEDSWEVGLAQLDLGGGRTSPPEVIRVTPKERQIALDGTEHPRHNMTFPEVLQLAIKRELAVEGPNLQRLNAIQEYFTELLINACVRQDLGGVTELLRSPLSTAQIEGRSYIKGNDIGGSQPWERVFRGFRALHYAAALGSADIVRLLLDQGANPASRSEIGLTPIHLAAMIGHADNLFLLLDAPSGQDSSLLRGRVEEPSHLAASYFRSDAVKDILRRLLKSVSHERKKHPDPEVLSKYELVPDEDEGPHTDGFFNPFRETPLHRAAAMNNIHAAEFLLTTEGLFDVNEGDMKGRTAAWHAAAAGADVAMLQLLLKHGASINKEDDLGRTPLDAACLGGHVELVREILSCGGGTQLKPTREQISAAHFAALAGNAEILKLLLAEGANLDSPASDDVNVAPIHLSAANGYLDCVRVLVEEAHCDLQRTSLYRIRIAKGGPSRAGTDPVRVTRAANTFELIEHKTPGEIARSFGHHDVVEYIYGMELDRARENDKRTTLKDTVPPPVLRISTTIQSHSHEGSVASPEPSGM